MTTNPREDTMKYFEQHQLLQVFDYIGAKLASEKPSDPNAFLLNELTKINAARTRGQKITIFTEKDIRALFSVFDLTNRGYLTKDQYIRGLFNFYKILETNLYLTTLTVIVHIIQL